MDYLRFKQSLKLIKRIYNNFSKLENINHINVYDHPYLNTSEIEDLITILFESWWDTDGRKIIDWWIFETNFGKVSDDTYPVKTRKELYKFLNDQCL